MIPRSGSWSSAGQWPFLQAILCAPPLDQPTALSTTPISSASACLQGPPNLLTSLCRCPPATTQATLYHHLFPCQAPPLCHELPEARAWSHSAQRLPPGSASGQFVGRAKLPCYTLALSRDSALSCHSPASASIPQTMLFLLSDSSPHSHPPFPNHTCPIPALKLSLCKFPQSLQQESIPLSSKPPNNTLSLFLVTPSVLNQVERYEMAEMPPLLTYKNGNCIW